jgi:ribosomal protein S12 methylthiotransferase accessory factor
MTHRDGTFAPSKTYLGCLGSGRLYQAVRRALAQEYSLLDLRLEDLVGLASVETPPTSVSLMVYCDDHWHWQTQQQINQRCLSLGIPWLRAYCEFGVGIIGPCVDPSEPGCAACAETRRRAAMPDATEYALLSQHSEEPLGKEQRTLTQPWLLSSHLEILAQLVVAEVSAFLKRPNTLQTRHALLRLELDTLHFSRHRFLPEPECPTCGSLPNDTPLAATITLQARPKLSPSIYRVRSLAEHASALWETYTDVQTGLIPAMLKDGETSVAMVTAWISISDGKTPQRQMSGTGRGLNYHQSELAAIAEALERYGGQRPKGKRTMIKASYRQLGESALDPTTVGLHSPEQYKLPGFRYVPYHPDLLCSWVWGYSFQRKQPILVPENLAYYGLNHVSAEHAKSLFVYEISNGCALGNCLEEAILYGILEVAERDAFLMTWYAQLSLPRLDPHSATDPLVFLLLEHLEHASGYTISLFNSTLDHGVPCCWVMAVDEQDRVLMPKILCTAGSHPDPEQAVLSALLELDPMVKRAPTAFETGRGRALEMLANPFAVTEMEDHAFLYYLPEAFERLSFLSHAHQPQQTFRQAFGDFYSRPPRRDLRDDLSRLIDHYLERGIDIVVVDQTGPEHAAQDFHCVKVLMPGMLPMTFGYQYRRTKGFRRLSHLPAQLGYRNRPLTEAEINPHPHPFP